MQARVYVKVNGESQFEEHQPDGRSPVRGQDNASRTNRREFVHSLAKKAAYAAPVIITLTATEKVFAGSSATS